MGVRALACQILSLIFLLELSTESKKPHYMRGGVPGKIDQLPFDGIQGIWAPKIKFWDPLNFTGALTAEQKARKRKAELKNGRLAMIGMISFLVGHTLPGAVPALSSAFLHRSAISPEVLHFMHEFFEMMAYALNTLIFAIAGTGRVCELSVAPTDRWLNSTRRGEALRPERMHRSSAS